MSEYLLILRKDDKLIGAMLQEDSCNDISEIYDHVYILVNNYNRHLAKVADKIPNEVFAHRFFEQEDVEGFHYDKWALMLEDSYGYVSRNLSSYFWPDGSKQDIYYGRIALTNSDIDMLKDQIDKRIFINLDQNIIISFNITLRETENQYNTRLGYDRVDVSDLGKTDINIARFNFNQIEDVVNLIYDNPNGWVYELDNTIFTAKK